MFHFPRFPTSHLCIQCGFMRHSSHGVSPFGYLRIKGCLPPPRSLSQAATSFFGTFCRAILRMLLMMLYNRFHIRLSRTKRSLILLIHYPLFSCESSILVSSTSFLRTRVQSFKTLLWIQGRNPPSLKLRGVIHLRDGSKNRRGGLIATKVVR